MAETFVLTNERVWVLRSMSFFSPCIFGNLKAGKHFFVLLFLGSMCSLVEAVAFYQMIRLLIYPLNLKINLFALSLRSGE